MKWIFGISRELFNLKNIFEKRLVRYKKYCFANVHHCVKSVSIRSFSCPYFPAFGLNTERYRVSLHIQAEYGENRDQKNSENGYFSRSTCYVKSITLIHKPIGALHFPGRKKYIEILSGDLSPKIHWLITLCTNLLQNTMKIVTKCGKLSNMIFVTKCVGTMEELRYWK